MTRCNKDRIEILTSNESVFTSEINVSNGCEQNLSNADMLDFRTNMDHLSFYENTEWNLCEDLIYTINEETLWQTIVGEIKTPLGALSNSVGQSGYGCSIWDYIGENIDSLMITEIEHEVIRVCLKYPEVNNVVGIETYSADNDMLFITTTLDSIYGTFDGELRIPQSHISPKKWIPNETKYLS